MQVAHEELVFQGFKWLRKKGYVSISEIKTYNLTGEIPDVIGFKHNHSILIECKTSRSDFLADKKKIFRNKNKLGVGTLRYFLVPEGLISIEELPEKWGLLEFNGKKITVKHGVSNNIIFTEKNKKFIFQRNLESENSILYSHLKRVLKNQ